MADMQEFARRALAFRTQHGGTVAVTPKAEVNTPEELATHYTPGIGAVAQTIADDPSQAAKLTMKRDTVVVVSDGSAVLGLGNVGPAAALPVMEGKAMLFQAFAGINAVPLVVDTNSTEEFITLVQQIAPTFGGIHLEDIGAPACFVIEDRLAELLDVPVFHDDQHGTAIVVVAALINALRVTERSPETVRVLINGAGAAGVAIGRLLRTWGVTDIVMLDSKGIITTARENLPDYKQEFAVDGPAGGLADAMVGRDIFIGVSKPGLVTAEMIQSMAADPIVCALANPIPEIYPEEALAAGAAIVATGRSDFPNQINNALVFPGLFRGLLKHQVPKVTPEIKLAAAQAVASMVECPTGTNLLPDIFTSDVHEVVAQAVGEAV